MAKLHISIDSREFEISFDRVIDALAAMSSMIGVYTRPGGKVADEWKAGGVIEIDSQSGIVRMWVTW